MVSILEREDEMNETDLMKKLHEAVQMVVIGVGHKLMNVSKVDGFWAALWPK